MIGIMLVYSPQTAAPVVTKLTKPPDVALLHETLGGYLELVPGFRSIRIDGDWKRCVAFCNEDGKREPLDVNNWATIQWDSALRHNGHPGLTTPDGQRYDYLVGNVVVLTGDPEFMDSL